MLQNVSAQVPPLFTSQLQMLATNLTTRVQAILTAVGAVQLPQPSGALGLAGLEEVRL